MQRGVFASKYRVSRLSTMTDASGLADRSEGEEEKDKLDETAERRWKKYDLDENIKSGSHALLLWTGILLVSRTIIYASRPECHTSKHPEGILFARLLEYGFLIITVVPLIICLQRPRIVMYLPVVCLHFVYLLALNLPPYSYSCQELFDLYQCDEYQAVRFREAATRHLDCSLQGHTCQQMCMTWLLIMPRVIPRKWMMHGTWIWIFVFYLGTTIWYIQRKDFAPDDVVSPIFRDTYFSDNDILFSIFILCLTNCIAISKKFYLEKSQKNKFIYGEHRREQSKKMFDILHYMVPVHVIGKMLKGEGEVIAEPIDQVSILFIMICDFDQYTRKYTPEELLAFLNEQFTSMDTICCNQEVTKIETVGEEYVAAVGVIPEDTDIAKTEKHGVILGRLIRAAAEILKCQEADVKFKMGIHTGPVVAGVIGHKLPRFRLFGDTINTSARMMQKSLPGELQFGEDTKNELPDDLKKFVRGPRTVEMKGKGPVETFFLDHVGMNEDQLKKAGAKGVAFATDIDLSEPRPSSSMMKTRKSLVATLQAKHAEAVEESDAMHALSEPEERRESTRNARLPSGSARGSSAGPMSSFAPSSQEVEMAAVSKESAENSRAPLLESVGEGRPSRCPPPPQQRKPTFADEVTEVEPSHRESKEMPAIWREAAKSTVRLPAVQTTRTVNMGRSTVSNPDDRDEVVNTREEMMRQAQFDKVLLEIQSAESTESIRSKWRTFGIDKAGFDKDMEKTWYKWYHETTICKKLVTRLDKQALMLSALTAFDTIIMVVWHIANEPYHLGEAGNTNNLRVPIFIGMRFVAFLLIMSWRVVAGSSEWVDNNPKEVQMRILGTYMMVAGLMFLSYDTLTVHSKIDLSPDGATQDIKTEILKMGSRQSSFFSLLVVPFYFIVITQFQLLFVPTTMFILLSTVLMCVNTLAGFEYMFFSTQGKAYFIINSAMNAYLAHEAEQTSRLRFKAKHTMDYTINRIETILNTLMPPNVVEDMKKLRVNEAPPSHHYNRATIAQSDLCGFTKLASTRKPSEVVSFIGELFGLFDVLTDKYGIYKVETVGDAYIAGQAEAPLTDRNKPVSVVLFGLDMVRKTHEWARGMGENVSCRVGVHSGECIGGIVGTEMQRYHLFGDLMTGLEVLESTAPEGKVQVSQACKEFCEQQMAAESLPMEAMMFEPREGDCLKTSKGEIHQFDEIAGRPYTVRSYAQLRNLINT